VLNVIPTGTDSQLHGALSVLRYVVEETLSEEQFFSMAGHLVKIISDVALNENRKPTLRALAVSVFRACFGLLDILKDDHKTEIKAFGERLIAEWSPFFQSILRARLPEMDLSKGRPTEWDSMVTLKIQVIKTLVVIKEIFADLLLPQSTSLFQAIWEELARLQGAFHALYVENDAQSRLENPDGLSSTLDMLVLEEIDFLKVCLRAAPVKAELDSQLAAHAAAHEVPWMRDIMGMLVTYACISRDDEGLWTFDSSLYLAEETSVSANYTARTASGGLIIKMGEWFKQSTVSALFHSSKALFASDNHDWHRQESAMYLFNMLLSDLIEMEVKIDEGIAEAYTGLVEFATLRNQVPLLQARGYLIGGSLCRMYPRPPTLLDRVLAAIRDHGDCDFEVVRVAAIKSIDDFISSGQVDPLAQVPMLLALSKFMEDSTELLEADELLVTVAEALRAVILMNVRIVLSNDVPAIDMLFTLIKLGSSTFQAVMPVNETFEEIVAALSDDVESYSALCAKVLPTLTGALDGADAAAHDPVVTVSLRKQISINL